MSFPRHQHTQACKQIYTEARFLPYAGNTFSFLGVSLAREFIASGACQHSDRITNIQLYGSLHLSDMRDVTSAFKNLQHFKVGILARRFDKPGELEAKYAVRPVAKVEVIVDYDDKGEYATLQSETRQKRREKAAIIGKCLMGTSDDF
ncbi:hypothetical protein Slin14017_G018420 [Septoria linicola]|nr:hypothetical protein Slin14017_G018420 [Septoria linicola]